MVRGLGAAALVLLLTSYVAGVDARYASVQSTAASTVSAATLGAPANLVASRPCSASTPTFVAKSTASVGSGGSVTVAKPAGTQAGDVLIAFAYTTADNGNAGANFTGPSGWTQLREGTSGSWSRAAAFSYLVPASSASNFTFDWGSSGTYEAGAAIVLAYRGADQSTPVSASAMSTGGGSSVSAPTVNVTRDDSVRVFGVSSFLANSFSTPAGMTARGTAAASSAILNDGLLAAFDEVRATTGNTPARSTNASGGSDGIAFSVVVQPDPDPSVNLSWTASADTSVTGYSITRTGGTTTTFAVAGRTTVTYDDAAVAAGTAYGYSVQAVYNGWLSVIIGPDNVAACA